VASITLERIHRATPDAVALVTELETEMAATYLDEQRHGLTIERIFRPNIAFLVAYLDERAVGCGGVAFEDGYAELKRMFVRPSERGKGIVQALIAKLEAETAARGIKRVMLETGDVQHAAIRAYERAGFTRRGAFGSYCALPPNAIVRSVFFEKRLV
jgi:putative acetyltransferase